MAASKDVAEKKENLPADFIADMEQDSGVGFEGTTADDYAIPYLGIAQSNSPQLKKSHAKYIEGIEMGNLFDTVEGRVFETVKIIPCYRDHWHVEWIPRDNGGGFVGRHDIAEDVLSQTERNEKGRDILPNGNEIIDTRYLYCLVVTEDGNTLPVVISFARTSTKVFKAFMTRANNLTIEGPNGKKFQAPLFSHVWTLSTVLETSRSGDEYYNFKVVGEPEMVTPEQYAAAKALREAVSSGEKGAATPEDDDTYGPAAGADETPTAKEAAAEGEASGKGDVF